MFSRRNCVGFGWSVAAALTGAALVVPAQPPRQADIFPLPAAGLHPVTGERRQIPMGNPAEAAQYYADLAKQLQFPGGNPPQNLDQLLAYFGYTALRAIDLEELPPDVMMGDRDNFQAVLSKRRGELPQPNEFAKQGWDILAARYFSPKTTDVSGQVNTTSWRKVVRLVPVPGSEAEANGLEFMYFLSVLYVEDLCKNPFENQASNVQVILTKDLNNEQAKLEDPLAWLVFDPAKGFALTDHTATSWDAADPKLIAKHGVKIPYYVPTACSHCHGGPGIQVNGALRHPWAVPQFFDTDYFQDRTACGEDFAVVGNSPWGTLFDAGKNPKAQCYRRGVEVFWRLNHEMLAPTLQVDQNEELPSTIGLRNWLRRHGEQKLTNADHLPPIKRGIPVGLRGQNNPDKEWSQNDPLDRELLPLLNRYC
ncbi:MAG: hypothetical protein RMJ88_16090 [Thermogemmata sp.]|nr:hypothetical protein [Thermogemmata sp.]